MNKAFIFFLIFIFYFKQNIIFSSPLQLLDNNRYLICLPLLNKTGNNLNKNLSDSFANTISPAISNIGYVYNDAKLLKKNEINNFDKTLINTKIIKINENTLTEILYSKTLMLEYIKKNSSQYLITGTLEIKNNNLFYKFIFIDALNDQTYTFNFETNRDKSYDYVETVVKKISEILWQNQTQTLEINSNSKGALIYIDDYFIGVTPLKTKFIKGEFTLTAIQDNFLSYKQKLNINDKSIKIFINNSLIKGDSILEITSNPKGAKIYLNQKFLGISPIIKSDLISGNYSLRISKKNFIDKYSDIELKKNKTTKLNFNLSKGETEKYFNQKQFVFGKTTYKDLTIRTATSSVVFFGGYLLFDAIAKKNKDTDIPNQNLINQYKQFSYVNAGVSFILLALSGYFLYKSLETDFYNYSLIFKKNNSDLSNSYVLNFLNETTQNKFKKENDYNFELFRIDYGF